MRKKGGHEKKAQKRKGIIDKKGREIREKVGIN